LPHFRDVLRADPGAAPWWARLLIVRETGAAAGAAGFTGPPDARGTVTLGYSVYPAQQRCGIASEAAAALVTWALAQPGVRRVQATIPSGHTASRRVAEKAGMRRVGAKETDDGLVDVWERARE
jgi:RimJ/RimL family protein N-acetyltransferase